jgi:hypothetical protein
MPFPSDHFRHLKIVVVKLAKYRKNDNGNCLSNLRLGNNKRGAAKCQKMDLCASLEQPEGFSKLHRFSNGIGIFPLGYLDTTIATRIQSVDVIRNGLAEFQSREKVQNRRFSTFMQMM